MKNYKLNEVRDIKRIREMMEVAVKEDGDKLAFRFKKGDEIAEVTYKEFYQDTESLYTAIRNLNVGDAHIAVIGNNSYEWLTVYLTMLQSNNILVPVDRELPVKDIINVLKHSDSEVLFLGEKYEKYVDEIKAAVPAIKYFIGIDKAEDDEKILSYQKFLAKGKKLVEAGEDSFKKVVQDENDVRLIVYTSGTTGVAKGVMLTEHNIMSVAYYGLQVADLYDVSLSVLPYHHTYEAVAGIILSMFTHGTICINDSIKNVLPNIQLFKPEHIYLVPAFAEVFYKKIWASARSTGKDKVLKILIKVSNGLRKVGIDLRHVLFKSVTKNFGGNLKEIIVGGAPVRPEIGKFFNDIGITLLVGYGITECSPLVSVNRIKFNDPATVGVILPCCEVKLIDETEDGIGEICVKGDIVMKGYYKDEKRTKDVLDEEGWFKTGDFGYVNKRGQLVITGRKKNIIVLDNGKNVYPEEIENYLLGIPYVKEVIVKGKKNEHGMNGSTLCAEFYLDPEQNKDKSKEEIQEMLKNDVREACKDLPIYKKVSDVEIREKEFNKTTTNKIKR